MKSLRVLFLITCALAMMGCYAARIETGRAAGTKVIEKKWASSWIYGLVPPSTINVASECPHGVAKVETQLSFLNQLVSAITWGIYTPDANRGHLRGGGARKSRHPRPGDQGRVQRVTRGRSGCLHQGGQESHRDGKACIRPNDVLAIS
jgi:hypothetical protein